MDVDWKTLRAELPEDVQGRLDEKRQRRKLGSELASLRKELSLTQQSVASGAAMTQNTVSKIEGSDDVLLSSITRYMHSIGGGVEVILKTADGKVRRVDLDPDIQISQPRTVR
jgi:transcriptional regulator with XRE-family HTH domain